MQAVTLISDPDTDVNMKGRFDANIIRGAAPGAQIILIIGHYAYDGAPFIGNMANVNVWDRVMGQQELEEKTRTDRSVPDQGSIVNTNSFWTISGTLVKRIDVKEEQTVHKIGEKKNLYLPVTALTKTKAVDLCRKFGASAYIGGSFKNKEEFDAFYEGLYASRLYVESCGAFDNGRLKTWLPYRHTNDSSALVHEITSQPLLGDVSKKYYVPWYNGPSAGTRDKCVGGYFGIVPKYENIDENDECDLLRCAACEVPSSLEETATLTLKGLCQYSFFDTTYMIEYDPGPGGEGILSYVGIERTRIQYDNIRKVWRLEDLANPYVQVSCHSCHSYHTSCHTSCHMSRASAMRPSGAWLSATLSGEW